MATHITTQVYLSHRWSINGEYNLDNANSTPRGDRNKRQCLPEREVVSSVCDNR